MVDCKPVLMSVDTHAMVSVKSRPPAADRLTSGASSGPSVPDVHPPWHRLHRPVDQPPHAWSTRAPPHCHEAHSMLSMGHPRLWPSPMSLYLLWADDLHWCRLGGLPEHTLVHLKLRCVPRCQPHLLVFKASECRLPLECRGQVQGYGNGVAKAC
jgi:hypothetical protein